MPAVPSRIGNWFLHHELGSGFSGTIWYAQNPYTAQTAALKIQKVDTDPPTNRYERYFYPLLQGGKGMPTLWASGVQGRYDYLVIDLLGPSLDNLYRQHGKQVFDLHSVICIAMQVLSRLEFMHSRGILHRDIQLGNCVIGIPPNEQMIYMIDFGFSKQYIDPRTRRHIPDSKVKRDFIGNYWFTSVNVHCRGKVPSRRDDLEALALMLIHLLTPNGLPWTRNGVPQNSAQEDRIIRDKRTARPETLCRGFPDVFEEFLKYCRSLSFSERPDYEHWRQGFADLARENGWAMDNSNSVDDAFYWPPRPIQKANTTSQPQTVPCPVVTPAKQDAAKPAADVANLLVDIANLNLNEHQIPGAKKPEKSPPPQAAKTNAKENGGVGKMKSIEKAVVVISSDEEDNKPRQMAVRPARWSKIAILRRLTKDVSEAINNTMLANVVHEFIELLETNRTKVLTNEGYTFLDALYKQLADPSIFIVNSKSGRQTRPRAAKKTSNRSDTNQLQRKGTEMHTLWKEMADAPLAVSNAQMAQMVKEFSNIIKQTGGRYVNTDGLAFLQGIEARLKG